jgi:hypothetical protein
VLYCVCSERQTLISATVLKSVYYFLNYAFRAGKHNITFVDSLRFVFTYISTHRFHCLEIYLPRRDEWKFYFKGIDVRVLTVTLKIVFFRIVQRFPN